MLALGKNSVMSRGSSNNPRKNDKITRILLTGGPCAGKTTILAKLQKTLDDAGYRVFCVPEAATMMMKGGAIFNLEGKSWEYKVQMQTSLLHTQISLEDIWLQMAKNDLKETGKPVVVFYDRGVLDGSAYVEEELWSQIMDEQDFDWNIRDKRYDAVVHMVTAAEGAEKFYDYENETRYETIPQARERDR